MIESLFEHDKDPDGVDAIAFLSRRRPALLVSLLSCYLLENSLIDFEPFFENIGIILPDPSYAHFLSWGVLLYFSILALGVLPTLYWQYPESVRDRAKQTYDEQYDFLESRKKSIADEIEQADDRIGKLREILSGGGDRPSLMASRPSGLTNSDIEDELHRVEFNRQKLIQTEAEIERQTHEMIMDMNRRRVSYSISEIFIDIVRLFIPVLAGWVGVASYAPW